MTTKQRRRPTRSAILVLARQRVELAREQLAQVHHLDPRFIDAINEFSDAIEARKAVEQGSIK